MMDNNKMIEMMEFFEFYEMYKAMKSNQAVSSRIEPTSKPIPNNINKFYDNNNTVQCGNDVIDLGENKKEGDVLAKFEMHEQIDINGVKYYCIKSGICTKKKMLDKNGQPILNEYGKPKYRRFNREAYEIAKNIIKSVNGIVTIDIPWKDDNGNVIQWKKPWNAWGYKTQKDCLKVFETLPKIIEGNCIDRYKEQINLVGEKNIDWKYVHTGKKDNGGIA